MGASHVRGRFCCLCCQAWKSAATEPEIAVSGPANEAVEPDVDLTTLPVPRYVLEDGHAPQAGDRRDFLPAARGHELNLSPDQVLGIKIGFAATALYPRSKVFQRVKLAELGLEQLEKAGR